MNFATLKGLTIPEGRVVKITCDGNTLWELPNELVGCIEFTSANSFTLSTEGAGWDETVEIDNGYTGGWVSWDGTHVLSGKRSSGYYIRMRGTGNTRLAGNGKSWILEGTDIKCNGNIENLLDYETVMAGEHPTMGENCYSNMFRGCKSLVTAPELPAPTLTNGCYQAMFNGCSSLTKAPDLPAELLTTDCYRGMFDGCTSLKIAPKIGAIGFESIVVGQESANSCNWMFANCTSLAEAPELKPTVLAPQCYFYMFAYCTSLKVAPELPATKLAFACYDGMFKGCTSLEAAPAIPAESAPTYCCCEMFSGCTSLKDFGSLPSAWVDRHCYDSMFRDCTSLAKAPDLPATILNDGCYKDMFNGCSSIILSETWVDDSYTLYRIPISAMVASEGVDSLKDMFLNTGGTFTGTPIASKMYFIKIF